MRCAPSAGAQSRKLNMGTSLPGGAARGIICGKGAAPDSGPAQGQKPGEEGGAVRGVRAAVRAAQPLGVELYPRHRRGEMEQSLGEAGLRPGAGGQSFIPETLPKLRQLRQLVQSKNLNIDIEVDGGINPETAKLCLEAGANVLVAGSSVFSASDPQEMIARLRG